MKKWVMVGTVLMFLLTLSVGNGAVQQADILPPTPFAGDVSTKK